MKACLLYLLAFYLFAFVQEQVRQPAVELIIDGKTYHNGDEINVEKGQLLQIKVIQTGGRKDFVKFPDNFVKHSPDIQIISRNDNELVYTEKGIRSEWKLDREIVEFASNPFLTVNKLKHSPNQATVLVGIGNFNKTYLKINLRTIWQFTSGNEQKKESNDSEACIYLNVNSGNNAWFLSKNIRVSGMQHPVLIEKLKSVQSSFDSIESCLFQVDYNRVQQEIRNLQLETNALNALFQQIASTDKVFKANIEFIGLPSDQPMVYLDIMEQIQQDWKKMNVFITQQSYLFNSLENLGEEKIKWMINKYLGWQSGLPENWLVVLQTYLQGVSFEKRYLPMELRTFVEGKVDFDLRSIQETLKIFFNQEAETILHETQLIEQILPRLKLVKLFDGMIRSYLSSINWAIWKNNREIGLVSNK